MKVKKFLIAISFVIILFSLFLAYSWDKKNVRTEKVTIYDVTSDTLTIEDKDGNLFSCWIGSTKNLECGKQIKATFITNGTKDVKDDSLVRFTL